MSKYIDANPNSFQMWAKEIAAAGTGGTPGWKQARDFASINDHHTTPDHLSFILYHITSKIKFGITPINDHLITHLTRDHSSGWRTSKTISVPQVVLVPPIQVEHAGHSHRQRRTGNLQLSSLRVLSSSWTHPSKFLPLEGVQHCQSQRPCIHSKWRQGFLLNNPFLKIQSIL